LESAVEPLFPFGYGLSYTTFQYGEPAISQTENGYTVTCQITNTGQVDAYEVPQLYTHQLSGDLVRPIKELKGYQKILIPAGETRTVSYTLTPDQLGYWHEEQDGFTSRVWFATDEAEWEVWVAPDARCQTPPGRIRF